MLRPELHPDANEDLSDAAEYYNTQRPGLGEQFLSEFWRAVAGLQDDPARWPIREYGFRKRTLQQFHHTIRYIERKTYIYIVAVPHCSQEPGYWKTRISDEQR